MQIAKKAFIVLVTLGCLPVNGMFDLERQGVKCFQPLGLKSLCARKVLDLIKSDTLRWEELSSLSENEDVCVKLFYIADYFMVPQEENPSPELVALIKEVKMLFHRLIDSNSEYLELFVATLKEWFKTSTLKNEVIYQAAAGDIEELFERIKIVLDILLDPFKPAALLMLSSEFNFRGEYEETDYSLMQELAQNAVDSSLVNILKMILELNIFQRQFLLSLFEYAYQEIQDANIMRILNSKLNITKKELADILTKNRFRFCELVTEYNFGMVRYIVELARSLQADIGVIINEIRLEDGKTLLMYVISNANNFDMVELLLKNGADVRVIDDAGHSAMFYAIQNKEYIMPYAIQNKEYMECYLSDAFKIIEILRDSEFKSEMADMLKLIQFNRSNRKLC